MALDLTTYAAAIKQYYNNIDFTQIVYKKFPTLGLLNKDTNFVGSPLKQPMAYATVPSRSATFATGQSLAGNSSQAAFLVTSVKDYGFAYIDRETMLASKTDDGAWLKAAVHEIDMAIRETTKSLAFAMISDGSGVIGTIATSSDVTTTTITLADPRQAVNFQVNDVLQAVAAGTSVAGAWNSAVRSGTVTVTAVNRQTGVLTASGNWNSGISAIATTDGLVKSGDFNAKISGLGAWLPLTAPTSSDSFFSVNRSVDSRLFGTYTDGRGMPIQESLILAATNIWQEGGSPDTILLNAANWVNLINDLGAKKIYYRELKATKSDGGSADVGYQSVVIEGPAGTIDVVADPFIPTNVAYVLEKDTWTLHTRREAPHIFDIDGEAGELLRQASSDSYEVRVGYYGNLVCNAPAWNGPCQLR